VRAVYETVGTYLGCCYLYPLGRRTELSEALLDYDVDISWWVTLLYDGPRARVIELLRRGAPAERVS
jgi:hypothetical protein